MDPDTRWSPSGSAEPGDAVREVARAAITAAYQAYLANALEDASRTAGSEALLRAFEEGERLEEKIRGGSDVSDAELHALVSRTLRAAADAMDVLGGARGSTPG